MIFVQEILEGIDNLRNLCIDSETEACPGSCPNDRCAVQILFNKLLKHGRWIVLHGVLSDDDIYGDMGECSNCGLHLRNYEWDYCPNCGAKMDGGEND